MFLPTITPLRQSVIYSLIFPDLAPFCHTTKISWEKCQLVHLQINVPVSSLSGLFKSPKHNYMWTWMFKNPLKIRSWYSNTKLEIFYLPLHSHFSYCCVIRFNSEQQVKLLLFLYLTGLSLLQQYWSLPDIGCTCRSSWHSLQMWLSAKKWHWKSRNDWWVDSDTLR